MTNGGNLGFEPLDFDVLQQAAAEGNLDALVAVTSDGRVTAYAPPGGEQTEGAAGGYKAAEGVQSVYASSSYYYCNRQTHTWWYCYINGSGVERCRDTGRPC